MTIELFIQWMLKIKCVVNNDNNQIVKYFDAIHKYTFKCNVYQTRRILINQHLNSIKMNTFM